MNADRFSADFQTLQFDDVSRHFGRRRALAHITLECRAGEILGLLGPNGAGKSTLLAIAATLLTPSAGEVRYGPSTAREGGAALRARIGLLAHDLHLYPELTALENLEFFARLYLLSDARRRAEAALERAGLGPRAGEAVSSFSRGMRQRLALERALVHDPRLVLLDEPFTGLDDDASRALVARLAALGERGAIVLVATHDLETVERLVHRIAVLREGRLVALDAGPGALRERYRRLV
ncbi:MAG: ABC transporter ATP-binding protein [Vicinamibacterales bacterium]